METDDLNIELKNRKAIVTGSTAGIGRATDLASCTGECGDAQAERDLFEALLPNHEQVLGADHPDVLATRNNLVWLTSKADPKHISATAKIDQ
ncbi:hypothetical protein SAMN05216428_10582 [Nitrosospira sp. Nsp11]|uniref:tetratricopeptide repeat protein n=1 Tax=Nitrosospira sp. Nsp11 TaxID=1855338 RepID=UPI000915396C|nr:tetratricopeptide repeat protein [Nitrosospira sp. Nsp11]SHL70893.1 hypothetical protein SAMN05216428_10582 [Nitrosospira sp. Nsp11]